MLLLRKNRVLFIETGTKLPTLGNKKRQMRLLNNLLTVLSWVVTQDPW